MVSPASCKIFNFIFVVVVVARNVSSGESSSTLPGINEEIFATLSALAGERNGGGGRTAMRKEGIASPSPPSPPSPAEDEVSANGDKPSAGN